MNAHVRPPSSRWSAGIACCQTVPKCHCSIFFSGTVPWSSAAATRRARVTCTPLSTEPTDPLPALQPRPRFNCLGSNIDPLFAHPNKNPYRRVGASIFHPFGRFIRGCISRLSVSLTCHLRSAFHCADALLWRQRLLIMLRRRSKLFRRYRASRVPNANHGLTLRLLPCQVRQSNTKARAEQARPHPNLESREMTRIVLRSRARGAQNQYLSSRFQDSAV
jgi:hypothetical protein